MTTRYYEVRECEHGQVDAHDYEHVHGGHAGNLAPEMDMRSCPGGKRRELTGVEIDSPGLFFGGAMSVIRGHYVVIPLGD